MGIATPLTTITLGAASVADDLGYVALTDLARALGGLTENYRVIGGHMVTVLAAYTRPRSAWNSLATLADPADEGLELGNDLGLGVQRSL